MGGVTCPRGGGSSFFQNLCWPFFNFFKLNCYFFGKVEVKRGYLTGGVKIYLPKIAKKNWRIFQKLHKNPKFFRKFFLRYFWEIRSNFPRDHSLFLLVIRSPTHATAHLKESKITQNISLMKIGFTKHHLLSRDTGPSNRLRPNYDCCLHVGYASPPSDEEELADTSSTSSTISSPSRAPTLPLAQSSLISAL